MTEIPEHLLKRSKERRAALGGGEAATEPAAEASPGTSVAPTAQAKAATPAPAAATPPPPKPDPAYVQAYKARRKVPVWAMMTLSILPLWAFMYVRSLTPGATVVKGPLGAGARVYSGKCSSCHGGDGAGGAGRELNNGEVLKTFPHIEDQLNLVYVGSRAYKTAGLPAYGDPARGHLVFNGAYMPLWGEKVGGELTDAEILAVVCHERYDLGGADPASAEYKDEFDTWCSEDSAIYTGMQDGSITFENITTTPAGKGALEVGVKPRPGHPAGK